MPASSETEGRNRWGTARERERMRARHEIWNRVLTTGAPQEASNGDSDVPLDPCELTEQDAKIVQTLLREVEAGRPCAFSLSTLSRHYTLLNKPIPTIYLSDDRIGELCTSRFGPTHARSVLDYRKALETCTIMEYAAWLGEYKLLTPLLSRGLDPTMRGSKKNQKTTSPEYESRRKILSSRILRRFFGVFPSSLSSYIVKRVVDMRRQHWEYAQNTVCFICRNCDQAQLCFGSTCHHSFCENCFWEDLCDNIDDREGNDVVLCPVCGVSGSDEELADDLSAEYHGTASERRQTSLQKYHSLPANGQELKKLPKQKLKPLTSSWAGATKRCVGSSQDIRRDKFLGFTERNAYHYVRGCLTEGVDINLTNEYGQTALHIAAWRGYTRLVELLVGFGADVGIRANGGVSAECSARANGYVKVVAILQRLEGYHPSADSSFLPGMNHIQNAVSKPKLEELIDSKSSHPGAGACIIDECLSSSCLDAVIELWRRLPVDQSNAKRSSKVLCSLRSYYCDSEGHLQNRLTGAICRAFEIDASSSRVLVFPHMRFLHYARPGSVLSPHVDLSRTDTAGQSSTHTFILYLFDCRAGGETSLLFSLTGDGRKDVLARVSPRRGRLLLFPHGCPHEGNEVVDVPKVLLRGEVRLK